MAAKQKEPTKKELVALIDRLRKSLATKDERIGELEAEVAELRGPVTMVSTKTPPSPKGKGRRRLDPKTFMTITRTPKA